MSSIGQSTGSIATLRAPSAIAASGAGRRRLGVALVGLLDEHLVPEPAGLPSHGGVGGDDEDIIDAPAPGQLHDQVEE